MATASSIVVITALVLYSTNIVIFVSASECINLLQSCEMPGNVTVNATVSGQNSTSRHINLKAVEEATMRNQCLSAIGKLMCISAISACDNNTNVSQSACMVVAQNCTEFVKKTYAGDVCPQIESYTNSSECVEVKLASTGYCPHNDTYKITAGDVKGFLKKASVENEKFRTAQKQNISAQCLEEYKTIQCKSFVSTCNGTVNITKESCEGKLKCLPINAVFNKTTLCSNFTSRIIPTTIATTTTQAVTTPYDLTRGFNTTLTVRLNTQFNSEYTNKSSSLYKSFARNIKDGLKVAYKEISGFQEVVVLELTCKSEIAVKHIVVTSSASPNVNVMEARLILANITSGRSGYLEGKVVEANKMCAHQDDNDDHDDDHADSNNWVYMIVFVCITALLLLAMVLCHQSK